MENNTNIIPDEDFLKEILSQVKTEEPVVLEPNDIDALLLPDSGNKEEVKTEQPTEKTQEELAAEEAQVQAEEANRIKRFGVKDTISSLIDNDVWVDMAIKYGDKEYENISDLLEKEKPSKELFDLLSSAQKKYREDLIDENYIKVGDKTTTKAKLINAILNDVDYKDLLEYDTEVIKPLQKIDFASIENGDKYAEAFVRQCLVEIDNYHPDSIDAVVKKLSSEFKIVEKAEEYQKITISNFEREIEKREIEKETVEKQAQEELRKEAKALEEVFKSQNIDSKFSKQLLKLRYTKDHNGKFHYENLIADKMKDKNFEAEFMHFILDQEDYLTKKNTKVKTETSKKFLELINMTPKEQGATASKKQGNLQTEDEDFFKDLGLI